MKNYRYFRGHHLPTIQSAVKMDKRSWPPQGYYKSIETAAISLDRQFCDRKPDVVGIYQAERIVAKKSTTKSLCSWSVARLLPQREHMGAKSSPTIWADRRIWKSWPRPNTCRRSHRADHPRVWEGNEKSTSTWGVDRDSSWCRPFPISEPTSAPPTESNRNHRPRTRRSWSSHVWGTDDQQQWEPMPAGSCSWPSECCNLIHPPFIAMERKIPVLWKAFASSLEKSTSLQGIEGINQDKIKKNGSFRSHQVKKS